MKAVSVAVSFLFVFCCAAAVYYLHGYFATDTGLVFGTHNGQTTFTRDSSGSIYGIDEGMLWAYLLVFPAILRMIRPAHVLHWAEFIIGSLVFGGAAIGIGAVGQDMILATIAVAEGATLARFILFYCLAVLLFMVLAMAYVASALRSPIA